MGLILTKASRKIESHTHHFKAQTRGMDETEFESTDTQQQIDAHESKSEDELVEETEYEPVTERRRSPPR